MAAVESSNGPDRALRIALIGPRATGKTTVAQRVAELSGREFFDLDEFLSELPEARGTGSARAAGALLADLGEERFRDLEELALARLEASLFESGGPARAVVLACGGGVLLREANVRRLEQSWILVYLRTPADELRSRLERDEESAQRPPLRSESSSAASEIASVLGRRESAYISASDFIVECVSADVESVAQRVIELCPRPSRTTKPRPEV